MGVFGNIRRSIQRHREKMLREAMAHEVPSLAQYGIKDGRVLGSATCAACGKQFQWPDYPVAWPIPLSVSRMKPEKSVIDVGGWCPKCERLLCSAEAVFAPLNADDDDWWTPHCRDCQVPLFGSAHLPPHAAI